jgi:hypothetical protein
MASVVDRMPEKYETRRKYDWDNWLDGQVWELVDGVDFTVPVRSMAAQVYQAAVRRGIGVSVSLLDSGTRVRVQAATNG